jgi:hypothetical protein
MRAPGGTETWSFHREQAGDGRALPPGAARARLPAPPVRRPPAPVTTRPITEPEAT